MLIWLRKRGHAWGIWKKSGGLCLQERKVSWINVVNCNNYCNFPNPVGICWQISFNGVGGLWGIILKSKTIIWAGKYRPNLKSHYLVNIVSLGEISRKMKACYLKISSIHLSQTSFSKIMGIFVLLFKNILDLFSF